VGLVVLALALFVGLYAAGVPVLGGSQDEKVELFNQGRACLVVGDYECAIQKFETLLAISPGDREAEAELERAQRLKTLSDLYSGAKARIEAGEWDEAAESLAQILQLDANYKDAVSLQSTVSRQQRLAQLYSEGKALYDQGQWVEATAKFDELSNLDNTYRSDLVGEYLFVCYLNHGLALVANSGDSPDQVREAIRQFGSALRILPRNQQAAEEQRLANLYLSGYVLYAQEDWGQAIRKVEQVFEVRPDYAGGRAAQILCASYVALGDDAKERGDLQTALVEYRKGISHAGLQCPPAQEREDEILRVLNPPTPTLAPTDTPLPATNTPIRPTAAPTVAPPTAEPTATPVPPQPTPVPTRKPKDKPKATNTPKPPPTNTPKPPPTNTPKPPPTPKPKPTATPPR
jgi:tetratricopeptide (TPR) repeat protein